MALHPIMQQAIGPLFLHAEDRHSRIFLAREDAQKLAKDLTRETGSEWAVVSHDYMNQSGYRTYTVEKA